MEKSALDILSEINDALVDHLKYLLEQKDLDALSKLIPIVDKLTTVLIKIHEKRAVETSGRFDRESFENPHASIMNDETERAKWKL